MDKPRHAPLPRLFNKRHGWQIKGLESAGGAAGGHSFWCFPAPRLVLLDSLGFNGLYWVDEGDVITFDYVEEVTVSFHWV